MLDRDPRYRDRFRQLYRAIPDGAVTPRFYRLFQPDWRELNDQWQVFIAGIEYGDDIPRTAIDFSPGRPLPAAGAAVKVAADRGWQNSGLQLQVGRALSADGHRAATRSPRRRGFGGPSPAASRSATIRAVRWASCWRPSGRTSPSRKAPSAFLQPIVVGLGATICRRRGPGRYT